MKGKLLNMVVAALVIASFAYGAGLTGERILQLVDQQEDRVLSGSLITRIELENLYSDGTTTRYVLGMISLRVEAQPERSLVYFAEPEDAAGMIFLWIKSKGEDARMWLFLPALGMPKRLVAEQRKQSFAGSAFTYEDIGSRSLAEDYTAELASEETVQIGSNYYDCYVLELTARSGIGLKYSKSKIWVDKKTYLFLKREDYTSSGDLARKVDVKAVGEFEGNPVVNKLIATDLVNGVSTTMNFLERRRLEESIPEEIFNSNNLPSFDPSQFGL